MAHSEDLECGGLPAPPDAAPASIAQKIVHAILVPDFEREVRDAVGWRRLWQRVAGRVEGAAQVLLVAGIITAYSAGYFDGVPYLSYVAGSVNVLCLALQRFSLYASRAGAEQNEALERLLRVLGLAPGAWPLLAGPETLLAPPLSPRHPPMPRPPDTAHTPNLNARCAEHSSHEANPIHTLHDLRL
jgi:hypothetical protein